MVCGTTAALGQRMDDLKFHAAIVDEASQA